LFSPAKLRTRLSLLMLLSIVLASSVGLVPVAVSSAPCVCGAKQVTILLFDFQDVKHNSSNTLQKYQEIIVAMNESLRRQSYEKLWLVGGEVFDWKQSPYVLDLLAGITEISAYESVRRAGIENVAILADSTLESARQWWIDPDKYFFGVYAGGVWPVAFPAKGVSVIGENWGVATYMHEFGHLIGLHDIYNPGSIGEWDVMGLAGKEKPLEKDEFSAWSRIQLGWLTSDDVVITKAIPGTLLEVESIDELSGTRAVMVPIHAQTPQYYVVIEARSTTLVIYSFAGYFVGYENVDVFSWEDFSWEHTHFYNFTCLAMIQTLSEEGPNRVFIGESTPISADIGVVLLCTRPHSLRIKLTSNADAKNAEEALKGIGLASNVLRGILLKSNKLNEAWESFQGGDFDAAKSSAEKAKAEAPILLTLQTTILVLVVACPIVGILLYNRRKKSVKTTMKPTPAKAVGSKFCHECGASIPRGSKFCEECGKPLCHLESQ